MVEAMANTLKAATLTSWENETLQQAVQRVALKRFRGKLPILGVPGCHPKEVNSIGPNSKARSRKPELAKQKVVQVLMDIVFVPVQKLLEDAALLKDTMTGRGGNLEKSLSVIQSVPSWGVLKSGDLMQDLITTALDDKPSRVLKDIDTATYTGPGAQKALNWIFQGSLNADPAGSVGARSEQWAMEQLALKTQWSAWGLDIAKLGSRQRPLDLLLIEFSCCDFQRAVR